MKSESQHTADILRSLGRSGWKCRKLPGGRFASGLPDAVLAKSGTCAMVEFKRPGTKKAKASAAGLTGQQLTELTDWAAAGVRSYVAIIIDIDKKVSCTLLRVQPDGTMIDVGVANRLPRLDWSQIGNLL